MENVVLSYSVNLPSIDEFGDRFPQYRNYASDEGRFLFDAIVTPENLIRFMVLTEVLRLPAVTGVAEECHQLVKDRMSFDRWSFQKQFIGAVVCKLMEANGFEKTGTKKSIPNENFTKGEVYRRPGEE